MSIRFVIGRAGSGKTFHCINSVRRQLQDDPIRGPRLLFLVPEQASLQMERALVDPSYWSATETNGGNAATAAHRAEVLSFQRLAFRILESAGASTRKALSEPARAMVLRHLLSREKEQLRYYRRSGHLWGLMGRLATTITELIQEAVDPADLSRLAGAADIKDSGAAAADANPGQRAKLHDLGLLYAAYLEWLGDRWLDPSQYLAIARENLPRATWLRGAQLWVDGFASLSEQEIQTLIALAQVGSHMDFTLLLNPTELSGVRGQGNAAPGSLFARTHQTFLRLQTRFREAGLAEEEPLILSSTQPPPRFRSSPALADLERCFVSSSAPWANIESPEPTLCRENQSLSTIELAELPTVRLEMDYAVSRVYDWVRPNGKRPPFRFRDIAMIVRDLGPYHDLLTHALNARQIPFFIDRRRPITHHPLVELIRSLLAVASEDLSFAAVRSLLRTDLVPLGEDETDELENYLLARGTSGLAAWDRGNWAPPVPRSFRRAQEETDRKPIPAADRLNRSREILLDHLRPWLDLTGAGRSTTGRKWADGLCQTLERLHVGNRLALWAKGADDAGTIDLAQEHRQAWREVHSLLDDLALALGEVELTLDELAGVLEAGLSGLTLGLVPPMVDQVLVGSIDRSRHPDVKAAVILGFTDAAFPHHAAEDPICNDEDRALLRDAGLSIGPPTRERILDEALFAYVALTRPSHELVISYPRTDESGKATRRSPFLDRIPQSKPVMEIKSFDLPARERSTWPILNDSQLRLALVEEFASRPELQQDDPKDRAPWNALYEVLRQALGDDVLTRKIFQGLSGMGSARLSAANVHRLFGAALQTSVSQLESYAACPFQHFGRYVLGLRERAEAALEPTEMGEVHHAILEDFTRALTDKNRRFDDFGEEEAALFLAESCSRLSLQLTEGVRPSYARDAYRLRRSAQKIARLLAAQRRRSAAGKTRPLAAELSFGFKGGLPPLKLTTGTGHPIVLRGLMDRVDLAEQEDETLGVVVDYKATPGKTLELSRVLHGLSLQLTGYMLVLETLGKSLVGQSIKPIAGYYVPVASQYAFVDHPALLKEPEKVRSGTYRVRGILREDKIDVLDDTPASAWSPYFNVYRGKEGKPAHQTRTDVASAEEFHAALKHTRSKLIELAEGILQGDITVAPFRLGEEREGPCQWCPMISVCRFELGPHHPRYLDRLPRDEVYRRMEAGTRESAHQ